MQSKFQLKTKLNIEEQVYNQLRKTAEAELTQAALTKYTQSVVLLSSAGNKYSALIKDALSEEKNEETDLFYRIANANDTEISCVLCMWQDKCIDIPSYAFRERLCELNSKNKETLLFVMTDEGASAIKLSLTMK